MVELLKSDKVGFVTFKFINKLTNKLSTCEFNVKTSIPGLYPSIRNIIECFDENGIEIHNYTDEQDRIFQKNLLTLIKEVTEFLGSYKQIKGLDKKELLIMLIIDIYSTEVNNLEQLTQESKYFLTSDIILEIFQDIISKTVVSVLMFKDIVNETLSSMEHSNCFFSWCLPRSKKKKYLK
jgi:hypothetical protein